MIDKPRRLFIKKAALKAFKRGPTSLPLDVFAVARSYKNIRVIPYKRLMRENELTYWEALKYTNSKDSASYYNDTDDSYIIYYNDINKKVFTQKRYRWSVAHELGHILLNHHIVHGKTSLARGGLSEQKYKLLEKEADAFAAYLLSPHSALHRLKAGSQNEISELCNISDLAAGNRYGDYKRWLRTKFRDPYDFDVDALFLPSLIADYGPDALISTKFYSRRIECENCGFMTHSKNSPFDKYCPICGEMNLSHTLLEVNTMKYQGITLNEYMLPITCPLCGNEEIAVDSNFCAICGNILHNKCSHEFCTHQDDILPGNFRFCVHCGSKTTYFINSYIDAWDHKEKEPATFRSHDMYDLEEDLPF